MPVLYRRGLMESTRVTMISPDYISPNPDQPRRYFDPDGLTELAESIRVHGILQPLSVRRKGGGRYELIAGERRLRAAMICGLEQVPCLVLEVSRESSCLLSLIENLQRRDLDFWEEAKALERLISVYGLSQEEAAAKVGKSQSAVANKLRLLRLLQEVLTLLRKNGFTERHARALLRLPTPRPKKEGAELLVKEGWTVSRPSVTWRRFSETWPRRRRSAGLCSFGMSGFSSIPWTIVSPSCARQGWTPSASGWRKGTTSCSPYGSRRPKPPAGRPEFSFAYPFTFDGCFT